MIGRRNLTDGWKFQLSQAKKEILLEVGKIAQVRKPIDSVMSTIDKTNHNTRDTIANDLGWSTGKVAMARLVSCDRRILLINVNVLRNKNLNKPEQTR